jgi:magnesium chelatase accessory protein
MGKALDWNREGLIWPFREQSKFVCLGELTWHVQFWPSKQSLPTESESAIKTIVLIHGTGASTHSWSALIRLLSQAPTLQPFNILAVDLPGHGFTSRPASTPMAIQGMSNLINELLNFLKIDPLIIIGHSAGAVVAIALDRAPVISINGALVPFGTYNMPGMAQFSKVVASNQLAAKIFSLQSRFVPLVEHLLDSTGSQVPLASQACYRALVANSNHTHAALLMMANWDLVQFQASLSAFKKPLFLISGSGDKTVSPSISRRAQIRVNKSQFVELTGLGHLAHEENPDELMPHIIQFIRSILDVTKSTA